MNDRQTAYCIVEKLNGDKERLVRKLSQRVADVAKAVGWKKVDVGADTDYMFVIGGDGTMTHAMKLASGYDNVPLVVGINIGKLGFLAEICPDLIEEFVISLVNGKCKRDERVLIQGGELEGEDRFIAVNEFAIVPKYAKDMITYEYVIDGASSGYHNANGLVLATPTGSTAYSLSIGGAILAPQLKAFQIVPIAPISLNSRSVVVSDQSNIKVSILAKKDVPYQLIADGQVVLDDLTVPLDRLALEFSFLAAPDHVALIHKEEWNFFSVLQEKLHWNTKI